jgi:hypothetical protein
MILAMVLFAFVYDRRLLVCSVLFGVGIHLSVCAVPEVALYPLLGVVPIHAVASRRFVGSIAYAVVTRKPSSVDVLDHQGWIPSLVKTLRSEDVRSSTHTVATLHVVAGWNLGTGALLDSAGAIEPLIERLSDKWPASVQKHAAATLRNIGSSSAHTSLKIVKSGGLESLLRLIIQRKSTTKTKIEAIGALGGLMSEVTHCASLSRETLRSVRKCIPVIVDLIPYAGARFEEFALSGLFAMSRCHWKILSDVREHASKHFSEIASNVKGRSTPRAVFIAKHALQYYHFNGMKRIRHNPFYIRRRPGSV